ncbi:hypothetical protein [Kitasatospora sp. NPDC090308]|uniref:hypothetical protein n=1 Tax=Kitasatospora sp. NPDC090308 TaxID=3364082 RepID=UPI003808BF88
MPGQRKRERRQDGERRRHAEEHTGWQWHPLHSTQDADALRAYLRSCPYDASHLRVDTLCGRLAHPTTYRVSVLMPPGAPPSDQEAP